LGASGIEKVGHTQTDRQTDKPNLRVFCKEIKKCEVAVLRYQAPHREDLRGSGRTDRRVCEFCVVAGGR
jgi:hypothetical protein